MTVLLLGVLQSELALAQSIAAGAVSGTALDGSGKPVTGAMVSLREVGTGLTRTRESRAAGEFEFAFLASGEYELIVEQIRYRPTRVVDIQVAPGADLRIPVKLTAAAPPVTRVDTVRYGGDPLGNGPGAEHAVRGFAVSRLPFAELNAGEAARFSTQLATDLGGEGLPTRGTLIAIDGIRHDVARHPHLPSGDLLAIALPLGPLARVDVLTAPVDGEWNDFGGAVVRATTRPGSGRFGVQASGDWTGKPFVSSGFFDPSAADYGSWRGSAIVSGPVLSDTAFVLVAVEGQSYRRPLPAAWIAGPGNAILAAASDSMGAGLTALLGPRVVSDDRLVGLVRLDWQLAERHRAIVSASVGFSERSEPEIGSLGIPSDGAVHQGNDAMAGALVTSRFSESVAHEIRVGFERSEREYGAGGLPATFLVTGERFGTDAGLPARLRRTGARLEDVFHFGVGSHRLKLGLTASFATHVQSFAFGRGGVYWFDDAAGFAAGRGVFQGSEGPPPSASFSVPQVGVLVHDQWTPSPGLELLTALRYDVHWLPRNEIPLNLDWLIRTGLRNQVIPRRIGSWSSRLGFVWRIADSAWLLRGGAGTYRDGMDPSVLGEVVVESGASQVRQGVGAVPGWPNGPSASNTTNVGERLALLAPGYEPPRSAKVSFGIARRLGTTGAFSVAANYRHTDFLIRRHDLNRLRGQTGSDQYDRPLYGSLVKEGGLLAANPGSNRQFGGFELVSALDSDGSSDYGGATVELHQSVSRFLRVRASYTFSETRDNWLSGWGGGPYAQLPPFPDSLNGLDWDQSRSDLDVPHRAAVGVEVWPLGRAGVSVGARYVVRSGRPFTPGFRPGVDANGDGSATNDPAFVDDGLPGMDVLLGQWPCLAPQVRRFAERNSCREPGVGALDVRIGVGPTRVVGRAVELWMEALNVTDESFAVRDHALHLVDPTAPLITNPATGGVSVPLVVNGGFGQPLAYRAAGRFLRFGLRVGY